MSISDPIGDMLTRIRNAQMRLKTTVVCPSSNMRMSVLDVLKREGYIRGYTKAEVRPNISEITIEIKYHDSLPVITEMKRVSKPGRRVYSGVKDIPPVLNGLGISILSTPKGVVSDHEARQSNVGGEILCTIY